MGDTTSVHSRQDTDQNDHKKKTKSRKRFTKKGRAITRIPSRKVTRPKRAARSRIKRKNLISQALNRALTIPTRTFGETSRLNDANKDELLAVNPEVNSDCQKVQTTEVAKIHTLSPNPFFNFLNEFRRKHVGLSIPELGRMAGQKWRVMTQEEKFPYLVMARKSREYRLERLQGAGTSLLPKKSGVMSKRMKKSSLRKQHRQDNENSYVN